MKPRRVKNIKVVSGRKSLRFRVLRYSSLSETAEELKRKYPRRADGIDAFVADLRKQMEGGGIALEEAILALMTHFGKKTPRYISGKRTGGKR